jgi:hypothetical protein
VDLAFSSSSSSSSSYSTSVTQFLFLWVFRFFEQIATDSPLLIRELQNLGGLVLGPYNSMNLKLQPLGFDHKV